MFLMEFETPCFPGVDFTYGSCHAGRHEQREDLLMIYPSSRSKLGRLLRVFLRLIPPATIVPVLNGPLRGMQWVVGSMPHGAWLGTLERYRVNHFVKRLRPGMTVWDIGANVGLYTLPSAKAVGSAAHVYAFEPLPRNLEYLRQHVSLNQLANVVIVPAAVGDVRGVLRMAEGDSPSEFHVDPLGDIDVSVIALDDWRGESGSSSPDLVKIDVEGAEAEVLRGGAGTFSKYRPPIQIELHGKTQREECGALLSGWGYRLVSLDPLYDLELSDAWIAEPS